MSSQAKFVTITAVIVTIGLTALTTVGLYQYDQDRTRFHNQHEKGPHHGRTAH